MSYREVTFCVARFWERLVHRISIRLSKNYLEMVEIGNLLTALEGLVMEMVLQEWRDMFFGIQRLILPKL